MATVGDLARPSRLAVVAVVPSAHVAAEPRAPVLLVLHDAHLLL